MEANGYSDGSLSTDGNWRLGYRESPVDAESHSWIDLDMNLVPQWMKDKGLTDSCLNRELAFALVRTLATAKGASDGWGFAEVVE
jgi:hypothetical protein